ncbi:MAG: hypothetical protein CMK59_04665 [Proteobacteria bacterium]|nr:hypothetical protein [Pseudomonadota bacterium]
MLVFLVGLSMSFAQSASLGSLNTSLMKQNIGGGFYDLGTAAAVDLTTLKITYPQWNHSVGVWYRFVQFQYSLSPDDSSFIASKPSSTRFLFRWHNSNNLHLYSAFGFEKLKLNEYQVVGGPHYQSFSIRPWGGDMWITEQTVGILFNQEATSTLYIYGRNALGKHIPIKDGYIIPMGYMDTSLLNLQDMSISAGFRLRIAWDGNITNLLEQYDIEVPTRTKPVPPVENSEAQDSTSEESPKDNDNR